MCRADIAQRIMGLTLKGNKIFVYGSKFFLLRVGLNWEKSKTENDRVVSPGSVLISLKDINVLNLNETEIL